MANPLVRFATLDDAAFIDGVIALPDVIHMVASVDHLQSVSGLIGDHIFVVCEGGFMYGEPLGAGDFGCIGAFLPEYRGLYAVMAMRESIRMAFTETECLRLIGTAFIGDVDISRMWKSIGVKKVGESDGRIIGSLDYLTWSVNDREMAFAGMSFADAFGIQRGDKMWASALGALLVSVANGNIVKGVHQHNLYSVGVGHSPIRVGLGAKLEFTYGGVSFDEEDIIRFVKGKEA
jgi:hypothetical protein